MAWRHRMQGTEIGFFFLSKRHVANWETSILIRWICWQGKEGVSEALCLLEGVVLMGRHRRVRWCLPFLYTVSLLFSSGLYGSLKLFEGSVLGSSLSELLGGWMAGIVLMFERVCRQKKKKPSMPMCTDKNENRFLLCFFLFLFLFLFSKMGLGYRAGETIEKQQVRRRRSFRSWGTRPILTYSFHLKYRLRIVLN